MLQAAEALRGATGGAQGAQQLRVVVQADGRVLDDALFRAGQRGAAPKLQGQLRRATVAAGVHVGFDRGSYLAEELVMALVYMQGFAQEWIRCSRVTSGTVEPYQSAVTFQHPDGYGGGDTALAVAAGGYVEAPDVLSGLAGGGQLQSCVQAYSTWTAGGTLLALVDSNGDDLVELRAADSTDSTRIAVLHNGLTIDTTAAELSVGEWHRLTARYTSGTAMTLQVYVAGQRGERRHHAHDHR